MFRQVRLLVGDQPCLEPVTKARIIAQAEL
jgi:hypothetical protein